MSAKVEGGLPGWPDIGPCRPGWYAYPDIPEQHRASIHPYMVENREAGEWYHKDSYHAVMARLREAVEALDLMEGSEELSNEQRKWIRDVLARIGPLPSTEGA